MNKINIRYWSCQLVGWGVWGLIILYFNMVVFSDRLAELGGQQEFVFSMIVFLAVGVFSTHLLRAVIRKTNWLRYSFNRIVLLFVGGVIVTGLVLMYGASFIEHSTPYSYDNYILKKRLEKAKVTEAQYGLSFIPYYQIEKPDTTIRRVIEEIKKNTSWYRNKQGEWVHEDKTTLLQIYQTLSLIAIWLLIYIVYHYVQRNRRDQLDRLKLESTVKELELKTIKSHINPHFIFNSLNSIRALVDENPQRARTAITELSNILRSSMQAEKSETVPLEKELNIVRDYLALEHMRFEERLKVEMDIDEKTLELPVPPMMLQTLVENAIKHGISKRLDGGFVKIISAFNAPHTHHILIVENSGQVNGKVKSDGFGIQGTEDRLNILYHGKAYFEINNINNSIVQSKVTIPINHQ